MNYDLNCNPAGGEQMEMAHDTLNVAKSQPLFQGDIICFQEIFEWLSLEDIQSVGQTCKRLQIIAADFSNVFYQLLYSNQK